MARSYTTRFAGTSVNGPLDLVLFTVPAGRTWVIRDISVFINDPGATVTFSEVTGTSTFAFCFLIGDTAKWRHVDLRQALHAGDSLRLSVNQGNCQLAVTGYDLSAV